MNQRSVGNDDSRIPKVLDKVRRMGRAMALSLPSNVHAEDLVAAGYLGVATALSRFQGDPEAFEPFAMTHARGAMLDELRRLDTMSRPARRLARRAAALTTALAARLGRQPDEHEMASEMKMNLAAYRDLVLQRSTTLVQGIDTDRVEAHAVPVDQQLDERRTRHILSSEVRRLPVRHATVLSLSFEMDETLQSIATTLGVSVARAHQIRRAALEQLRRRCTLDDLAAVA